MVDIIESLHKWTSKKKEDRLLARWGMIRRCPWCSQWVETNDAHSMKKASHNPFFDTFTCGVCGGESHWEFGPAPIYRGVGKGPSPFPTPSKQE